jgi:hypothetical protein
MRSFHGYGNCLEQGVVCTFVDGVGETFSLPGLGVIYDE